jgi:hypothetical protein
MEQLLTLPLPVGGVRVGGERLDDARPDLGGILAEADRILDGLEPINAEEYLQQNRQQGGQ